MVVSNKSIIDHIPCFLKDCERKGFSIHTQKNYQSYLNKFKIWLKDTKKENIKPHELTSQDISNYRVFLSDYNVDLKTNKILKKLTQNYYLVALRALLSYFSTKDYSSLPANKVELHKVIKAIEKSCTNLSRFVKNYRYKTEEKIIELKV